MHTLPDRFGKIIKNSFGLSGRKQCTSLHAYHSGGMPTSGRDRNPGQTACTNHLQSSRVFGVCDNLSEIHSCSIKRDGFFFIFDRLPNYDPSTSSGENSKSKERVSTPPRFAGSYNARIGQGPRSPYIYHPGCFSSSSTLPPFTGRQKQSSRFTSQIQTLHPTDHSGQRGTGVVEGQLRSLERQGFSFRESRLNYRNRCLQKGLGSILHGNVHRGWGWSQAETFLHINCLELLAGAFAVKTFTKGKAQMTVRLLMDNMSTAHYINKMGGIKSPVMARLALDLDHLGLVSTTQDSCGSQVPTRHIEHSDGQGVQSNGGPSRLGIRPPSVLHNKSIMGPTGSGPICLPVDNTTPQVIQLETRPTSGGIGCIYPGLEQGEGIRLPSFCSSGQMPQATDRSECAISGTASSSLAVPAVVFTHYQGLLSRQTEIHPLDNLQLAGWLLSANTTLKQTFYSQLKSCCWQHGAKAQPLPMLPLGENGIAGVVGDKLIQFMHS